MKLWPKQFIQSNEEDKEEKGSEEKGSDDANVTVPYSDVNDHSRHRLTPKDSDRSLKSQSRYVPSS